MKKTFPLNVPGHQPPRVVEAIKNDVRKYLKRERRKDLPDGANHWRFDCKIGFGEEPPESVEAKDIVAAIDRASEKECGAVYIEILAAPAFRPGKEPGAAAAADIAAADAADEPQ
ncbi:MAG: hypothetical protein JWL90_160 [Chthoniobacteraceae bacterium]|nr:hypothetical protein [Chthoniobacteraceae bacterium]